MENIDLGKSANQIWRESGSTLSFKSWLQREKDKGRFLPNKQLIEFNSINGDEVSSSQELIKQTLQNNKPKTKQKTTTFGLDKGIIMLSVALIIGGIAYKIYQKKSK
jgi:hypothetical protein